MIKAKYIDLLSNILGFAKTKSRILDNRSIYFGSRNHKTTMDWFNFLNSAVVKHNIFHKLGQVKAELRSFEFFPLKGFDFSLNRSQVRIGSRSNFYLLFDDNFLSLLWNIAHCYIENRSKFHQSLLNPTQKTEEGIHKLVIKVTFLYRSRISNYQYIKEKKKENFISISMQVENQITSWRKNS